MTTFSPQDGTSDQHSGSDDAQLIPFPLQPPAPAPKPPGPVVRPEGAVEPAPEVLDGELITEAEYQRRTRLRRVTAVVIRGADRTRGATAAVAPRVAPPVRVVVHVVYTVGAGHVSWLRRAAGALTHGPVREQIRLARRSGDPAALAEWTERLVTIKDKRAKRLQQLPKTLLGAAKGLLAGLCTLAGLLLLTSVWVTLSPGGLGWGDWWSLVGDIANGIGTTVSVAVNVAFWGALPALLLAAWLEGRRVASAPRWLATSADSDIDVAIDETTIANALAALRIPQIGTYLKQGLPLQYITPARRDGRGTHAVVRLPAGVTAERIARRRADLATGLHRLAKEVWPTTGSEAGILDLWVADKGALAQGAGPYPLLEQGAVDVFRGVPFGKTLRGDPIVAPVMERNTITGGMPGQGKSAAARVLMAGAALDPTAELRIWIPDSNFDFEAFRPRCSRFVVGAEDERVEEILEDLRELQAEVQARGELLIEHEEAAVTRALASKNVGLHPLFCLLEEAHVAIQHKGYGGEISELLCSIVRLGRKRGIHMIVSTQAPTKDSMPRDVTRNCTNGIAFAVGDHVANDALLGQGAYAGGHRATELIPGTDRGTAVVKGFSENRSELVQSYFLDVSKGNDQVTPIIERSCAAVAKRGRVPGQRAARQIESLRDLLDDLDEVLGNEPVPAADVPALLARLAPKWMPYRRMTGKSLRTELAGLGIKVASTGNRWPVDPVAVREVVARRATADLDDEDR